MQFTSLNRMYGPAKKAIAETGGDSDPYWDNVSLLLSFEGDNGATATTDASNSNTPVTFYGDAQLSTTQAKFGSSSLYLDGNGDYLRADAALATLTSVTTPYTIDVWIYPNTISTAHYIFGINDVSNASNRILICYTSIYIDNTQYTYDINAFVTGEWQLLSYQYDGLTHQVFRNGQLLISKDNQLDVSLNNCVFGIGAEFDAANGGGAGNYINAYLDELRVTAGIKRYTIDPVTSTAMPTSAYTLSGDTYASDVSLLSNFDSVIDDESAFNHTSTIGGSPAVSATESKFGGASLFLDGASYVDFVQQSSEFTFGTGDFTIEFWFYRSASLTHNIIGWDNGSSAVYCNSGSNTLYLNSGGSNIIAVGSVATAGAWHHVILQRERGFTSLFVDGNSSGAVWNPRSYASSNFNVGRRAGSASYFDGYIDSVRVTSNVARVEDTAPYFDVPTEAFSTN
jgi:hypothetical protein